MSQNWSAPWADPFVDRAPILASMAEWVEACRRRQVPSRMYLHAATGMGTSCTATHFSRQHSSLVGTLVWQPGRRPDGTAVPLGEVLTSVLRRLDAPGGCESGTEADKAAALAVLCRNPNRRFALVVDDHPNPALFDNIIPADAPGVTFIATATARNNILDRQGFKDFPVTKLPSEDARRLFDSVLGDTAAELDDAVIAALVDTCCGFPLLLRVLAAHIRGRAPRAARILDKLRNSRLPLLALDSAEGMNEFLNATYGEMTSWQATAYRWLGSLPMEHFSLDAAAAIMAEESDTVFDIVEELHDLNLITIDQSTDRYSMPAVLRADAQRRADDLDGLTVRRQVAHRWTSWFLREALPRGRAISNRWWVDAVSDLLPVEYDAADFTRAESTRWFELEKENLVSVVRTANRNGFHDIAWPLCIVMWKYLHVHGLHDIWIDTHHAGLESARILGVDAGIMQLTNQLGSAYLELGQYDDARSAFMESLTIARRLRHAHGEQSALEWLGKIEAAAGRPYDALEFYRQSLDVAEHADPGQLREEAKQRIRALLSLQRLRAYADLADWDRVIAEAPAATDYFDRHENRNETDNRAKPRLVLGRALLALGDPAAAIVQLRTAVDHFDTDGARRHQADARYWLARAYSAAHQSADAEHQYRAALSYYSEIRHPRAHEIREILTALN